MNKYLFDAVVPPSIPTAAELVELGHAHIRDSGHRTFYVIHDTGHRLLGELLREQGRRTAAVGHVRVTAVTDVTGPQGQKRGSR